MPKNVFSGDVNKPDGSVLDASEFNTNTIFGNGSDGSYTSGNDLTPGKVYNFTDFTLKQGDTLQPTSKTKENPVIVKVQGDVDISGTIDFAGQGMGGGATVAFDANERVSAGEQHRNAWIATTTFSDTNFNNATIIFGQMYGGGIKSELGEISDEAGASTGGTALGSVTDVVVQENLSRPRNDINFFELKAYNLPSSITNLTPGAGGGGGIDGESENQNSDSGAGGGGGASKISDGKDGGSGEISSVDDSDNHLAGKGGNGGGMLIFIVGGDITFSGTIDVSGADGEDATQNSTGAGAGGGGGGGGGEAWFVYKGSLTDNGTKNASGGLGGAGSDTDDDVSGGDGGDGGNGNIKFEPVS